MSTISSVELKKLADKGLSASGSVQVAKNGARYVKVSNQETGKIIGTRFLTGAAKGSGGSPIKKRKSSKKKNKININDVVNKKDISESKINDFDNFYEKHNEIRKQKAIKIAYNKTGQDLAGGGFGEDLLSGISKLTSSITNAFSDDDSAHGGGDGDDVEPPKEPPPPPPEEGEEAAKAKAEEKKKEEDKRAKAKAEEEKKEKEEEAERLAQEKKKKEEEKANKKEKEEGNATNEDVLVETLVQMGSPYCSAAAAAEKADVIIKQKDNSDGGGSRKKKSKLNDLKELQAHMGLVHKRLSELVKQNGGDAKSFVTSLNSSEKHAFRDLSQSIRGGSINNNTHKIEHSKGGSIKNSGFADLDSQFNNNNVESTSASKSKSLSKVSSGSIDYSNKHHSLNKSRSKSRSNSRSNSRGGQSKSISVSSGGKSSNNNESSSLNLSSSINSGYKITLLCAAYHNIEF